MLYWLFSAMACWIAAMTVLSVAEPFWSSARRLMMLAFGAMPRDVTSQFAQEELPPLPAMMPATWVPWPYRSLVVVVEGSKFWLYTMRLVLLLPACVKSKTGFTPLSMTATPTPVPSYPRLRAMSAPTAGTAKSIAPFSGRSSETYLMLESLLIRLDTL